MNTFKILIHIKKIIKINKHDKTPNSIPNLI